MLKQAHAKVRHSGLDPESSGAPLDSGVRRNDDASIWFWLTDY
jgi:hypothetical protein